MSDEPGDGCFIRKDAEHFRAPLTWAFSRQGFGFNSSPIVSGSLFRYPGLSPFCDPGRFRTSSNSHTPTPRGGRTKRLEICSSAPIANINIRVAVNGLHWPRALVLPHPASDLGSLRPR